MSAGILVLADGSTQKAMTNGATGRVRCDGRYFRWTGMAFGHGGDSGLAVYIETHNATEFAHDVVALSSTPDSSNLERAYEAKASTPMPCEARPHHEWSEKDGSVLRRRFPVEEPPYVDDPREDDFPGEYVTHWTGIIVPAAPFTSEGSGK